MKSYIDKDGRVAYIFNEETTSLDTNGDGVVNEKDITVLDKKVKDNKKIITAIKKAIKKKKN